jgi:hypothetical protein
MPRVLSRVLASGVVLALTIGSAIMAAHPGGDRAIVGTLQRVEGETLTVLTSRGTEKVMLPPSATVRAGSHTLSVAELASRIGTRIKVRYKESAGQKEAQSITVAAMKKATRTT